METLEELRNQIDQVDRQLLKILTERMEIVKKMGEVKKLRNMKMRQPEREKEVLAERKKIGQEFGLSAELIERIFEALFREAESLNKE